MLVLTVLFQLLNLLVLVLLVVLAIFGIRALRKYLKTPAGPVRSPLAANLGQRRLTRGMTPEAVAQALGVSPQTVAAWEAGTLVPDDGQLAALAKEYGCSIAQLFQPGP